MMSEPNALEKMRYWKRWEKLKEWIEGIVAIVHRDYTLKMALLNKMEELEKDGS